MTDRGARRAVCFGTGLQSKRSLPERVPGLESLLMLTPDESTLSINMGEVY